jgi:peptide/nickel transport system permease protein
MGTDDLGRDVFSRFLYGARISFFIGSSSGLFTVLLGVSVGAFSGYYGGKIDYLLQKVTEIFLVFPRLILAMLFLFMFGTSLFNMVLVIAAFSWPRTARVVRGEALKLREAEFVEALRIMGVSNLNIIFREIMPNLLSSVVVLSSLEVAHAMLTEASLTYLGLGDPNVVSWGQMLFGAQAFSQSAPWLAVFPGLGIFLSVMSLNLIGDALNRTLNPRRRRREMTVLS